MNLDDPLESHRTIVGDRTLDLFVNHETGLIVLTLVDHDEEGGAELYRGFGDGGQRFILEDLTVADEPR